VLIKCMYLSNLNTHPFEPCRQLHAIVVDILRSEIKRKKIRRLIRKLCAPKHCHLVPIRSMKIRWNTTYAEVLRALDLKPVFYQLSYNLSPTDVCGQALNQWIDLIDQSLSGKAKAAAKCCQKKWRLSPDEWETLAKLCSILKVRFTYRFGHFWG
jgi:hypothetical protein